MLHFKMGIIIDMLGILLFLRIVKKFVSMVKLLPRTWHKNVMQYCAHIISLCFTTFHSFSRLCI